MQQELTFLEQRNYTAARHYGFLGNRANDFECYQLLHVSFTQAFNLHFYRLVDLNQIQDL